MNILYLAHRIPFPPNKGDKLRAFRQLEHLSRRHRVWCACFLDDPADLPHIEPLRNYCHQLAVIRWNRRIALVRGLAGLARGRTLTESFYHSSRMTSLLRRWTRTTDFDAVVAFSSSMADYALAVPAARHVLDLCDLDSRKWHDYAIDATPPLNWLYRSESARLARREIQWIRAFDASILITRREADSLPPAVRRRIQIVSNGVNLPEPTPVSCPTPPASSTAPPTPPIVGFLGQMDYKPNVDAVRWFVDQCWPTIRAEVPHAAFRIVGRCPTRAVRRLARIPGVAVTGEVRDAAAEVARFDVCVAPLQIARGLQNKVLEAMAAARPVVMTDAVAAALDIANDHEALIAGNPASFAAAVIRLLADTELRRRLGSTAQAFVARQFVWERELERFELLVTGATAPQTSTVGAGSWSTHSRESPFAHAENGDSSTFPR